MAARDQGLDPAMERKPVAGLLDKRMRRRGALGLMGRVAASVGLGGVIVAGGSPSVALAQSLSASARRTRSLVPPVTGVYPRVFMTGDSLTWGSVASLPNYAYPWQVITGLRARGSQQAMFYRVDGQPGINTAGDIVALQEMSDVPVADALIVEIGVLDWGQNNSPSTFQAQYVALLKLLVRASPAARLVALTCWQDASAVNSRGDPVSLFNQIITDAALNKSGAAAAQVAPLGSLYLNPAYHNTTGDTYHPNDAGHLAIATEVLGLLP